ncbi:class I SAM-dependent methyltransferase [Candidatus Parcubacteria bacterium]|nr:class I SAM-dependent methyltransferase [Candidatus Parcubacteria bacterium]
MKITKDPGNIRDYFKKWPRFYFIVREVFSPVWWSGVSQKNFIKLHQGGKIVNLGSGPEIIDERVINVDAHKYPSVSVVADITKLPFEDNSIDSAICNTVLEHVKNPEGAVSEMHRVLRSGGYAYTTVPFLYPFHASPDDYTRWTHAGVRELFKNFEIEEIGVRAGPFSLLATWLCYICATIFSFNSEFVYWILVNLFMFIFFPIKILDVIGSRLPFSIHLSAILYVIVRKK